MQTDYFVGKKVLITGGAGYLATNLIEELHGVACHITRFDREGSVFQPFDGVAKIVDVTGDIRTSEIWSKLLSHVDVVYHFAAQTSVYVANEDPAKDHAINVRPMLDMLETCRKQNWKPAIIFSGTVTETGIPTSNPVDETFPDSPVTIYDVHKLVAETYLKAYVRQGFVKGAILRLANVYGPGPRSSSADRGILNIMMRKGLKNEALPVYGDGNFIRDYVFVKDVAKAFVSAANSINIISGGHFIIGSGKGISIADAFALVAERVAMRTGINPGIKYVKAPPDLSPIEKRNFVGNIHKFNMLTGWKPAYSLADGIDLTLEALA